MTSICIPGGKINSLSTQINKLLQDSYTHTCTCTTHIIMVGGICNFATEKITHVGGTELTYNRQNKVSDITTQLTELSTLYNTIPNTKFTITSIAPVSLHKHITHQQNKNKLHNSIFTHEHLCQQQAQLEEDIHEINTNISHINKCHRVRSIRWDRDIMKVTIKKRGRNGKNKQKYSCNTHTAPCLMGFMLMIG